MGDIPEVFGACLGHSCQHAVFHGFDDNPTTWLLQGDPQVKEGCFSGRNLLNFEVFPPGLGIINYNEFCSPFDFSGLTALEMQNHMAASPIAGFDAKIAEMGPMSTTEEYVLWGFSKIAEVATGDAPLGETQNEPTAIAAA